MGVDNLILSIIIELDRRFLSRKRKYNGYKIWEIHQAFAPRLRHNIKGYGRYFRCFSGNVVGG